MRIHLITPIVTEGIRTLDDVAPLQSADLTITQSLIATGPVSIECEFDEAMSVPGIVAEAIAAEGSGADALIIDCMGDPGLKAAREVVSIPVLGPSEASMHLAAMLGHRFSVVTVLDSVVPMIENLAKVYGTSAKLASVRVINIPVLELEASPEKLTQALHGTCFPGLADDQLQYRRRCLRADDDCRRARKQRALSNDDGAQGRGIVPAGCRCNGRERLYVLLPDDRGRSTARNNSQDFVRGN